MECTILAEKVSVRLKLGLIPALILIIAKVFQRCSLNFGKLPKWNYKCVDTEKYISTFTKLI